MQELKIIGNSKPLPRAGSNFFQFDKGKYLVIGGVHRSDQLQELADFWTLLLPHQDGNLAGIWQELQLENQAIYTGRSSQAACMDAQGLIYIFGGQKFTDGQSTDEFFCLDPKNKKINYQPQSKRPKGRNSHTLTYHNNMIFLYGGANESGPLGDLWRYDLGTQKWNQIDDVQDQLIGREMHTAHLVRMKLRDPTQRRIIQQQSQQAIVGLDIGHKDVQDEAIEKACVKELSISAQVEVQELFPQLTQDIKGLNSEAQGDLAQESEFLMILGGRHKESLLNEIQLINLTTFEVILFEKLPVPLCAHTSVQVRNSEIYIFGGFDGQQLNRKIFLLKEQQLDIKGDLKVPLMASTALYTEDLNKIVVFGGCTLEIDLNQVFVIAPN